MVLSLDLTCTSITATSSVLRSHQPHRPRPHFNLSLVLSPWHLSSYGSGKSRVVLETERDSLFPCDLPRLVSKRKDLVTERETHLMSDVPTPTSTSVTIEGRVIGKMEKRNLDYLGPKTSPSYGLRLWGKRSEGSLILISLLSLQMTLSIINGLIFCLSRPYVGNWKQGREKNRLYVWVTDLRTFGETLCFCSLRMIPISRFQSSPDPVTTVVSRRRQVGIRPGNPPKRGTGKTRVRKVGNHS